MNPRTERKADRSSFGSFEEGLRRSFDRME